MLGIDISVQIKAFDKKLTERLENKNFIINNFDDFGIKYEGSDIPQWEKWDPAYGYEKTTPNEMEFSKIMEEPRPDVNYIGSFDKYIGVKVKLDDGTNSSGNISTVKQRSTNANVFAIGRAHNNPLLDTKEYEIELEDGTTDR